MGHSRGVMEGGEGARVAPFSFYTEQKGKNHGGGWGSKGMMGQIHYAEGERNRAYGKLIKGKPPDVVVKVEAFLYSVHYMDQAAASPDLSNLLATQKGSAEQKGADKERIRYLERKLGHSQLR